jgi:hypothetical protein
MAHTSPLRPGVRLYKKIAVSFIILTLILLGVVLASTVSRATITIVAKEIPVKANVKVTVADDIKTSETVRGTVVANTVEGSLDAKPAGKGQVVEDHAHGTVLLVNKKSTAQPLVATTRLLTPDGVLFRIKKSVTIPANGELKDVEVYADEAGAKGEIAPATFTVPGLNASLQKIIYAFSEKPMVGGVTTVSAVAQADIDSAFDTLRASLEKSAKESLGATMKEKGFEGISLIVAESTRSSTAKAGDQTGVFTVTLKLDVNAVIYDREKFNRIGLAALQANQVLDTELRTSELNGVVPVVQNADAKTQTATLVGTFTGTAVLNDKSPILSIDRLVGLDGATLVGYLKSFDSVADAAVVFSPFWVHRVPHLKDHIVIVVK